MEIKTSVDMNQLKMIAKELKRFFMLFKFELEEIKTKKRVDKIHQISGLYKHEF